MEGENVKKENIDYSFVQNQNIQDKICEKVKGQILYLSFNLDSSCFSVGHKNGFIVYDANALKIRYCVDDIGEIKIVEVLKKTNLSAFVGSSNNKLYSTNCIQLWDDRDRKIIAYKQFNDTILKIKFKSQMLFIVTTQNLYVLNTETFETIDEFELNYLNPKILSVSSNDSNTVLSWSHNNSGKINIKIYNKGNSNDENSSTYVLSCHNNPIRYISLNNDGTLLATASIKGTLIRIFDITNGASKIQEVRRGSSLAEISLISFNHDSKFLCVSSDKNSIHIFSVRDPKNKKNVTLNQTSTLKYIPLPTNYFTSEWSFAKIYLSNINDYYIISFASPTNDHPNSIIVISKSGICFKYTFKPNTSQTNKILNGKWLQ